MIIVKVSYTVKQEFVLQNQENVDAFLKDFQQMGSADFLYSVYLGEDGKTFVHLSHYKNEQIQKTLLSVGSFKFFQEKRDKSGLETAPKIEVMKLIGSSADILI